jgi:hypothetical protein
MIISILLYSSEVHCTVKCKIRNQIDWTNNKTLHPTDAWTPDKNLSHIKPAYVLDLKRRIFAGGSTFSSQMAVCAPSPRWFGAACLSFHIVDVKRGRQRGKERLTFERERQQQRRTSVRNGFMAGLMSSSASSSGVSSRSSSSTLVAL